MSEFILNESALRSEIAALEQRLALTEQARIDADRRFSESAMDLSRANLRIERLEAALRPFAEAYWTGVNAGNETRMLNPIPIVVVKDAQDALANRCGAGGCALPHGHTVPCATMQQIAASAHAQVAALTGGCKKCGAIYNPTSPHTCR